MKRSTRRRLKRFFHEYWEITGVVLGIGGILIVVLPARFWPVLFLALLLVELIFIDFHRTASRPEVCYFEEVSFGEPTNDAASPDFQDLLGTQKDRLVLRAVHGLLSGEKAKPVFVHAAPINREVGVVCEALQKSGFSTLYGGPGEGKSMTAYHVAHRLYQRTGYSPYALKVDLLVGRSLQDQTFRDDLEAQLDSLKVKRKFNLRRKPKLIIVDDAQKLRETERRELNQLLRDEALEGASKVVWLETEFYEGTTSERPESHVRVNFRDFAPELVREFYRSTSATVQSALQGQTEGLDEAIKMTAEGRIRDAWHFAFVASGGEKRVEKEISKLDDADSLVLFLVSAHSVISGEAELSTAHLVNLLETLKLGWLKNALREGRSFSDMIQSLQEHKSAASPDRPTAKRISLIRLYDKSPNDRGYIASLHFNAARAIVKAALLRTQIANDLMESLRTILTSDYRTCRYVEILIASLQSRNAQEFVKANESWLIGFLNNPMPETIPHCGSLLAYLKTWDTGDYRTIVDKLDLDCLARSLAGIDAGGFNALVDLLKGLGHRREEFLGKVPWLNLADGVAKADLAQFSQVAYLLNTFKYRRDTLLEKVSWQDFADRVAKADVDQFSQAVDLLRALWDRRHALLEKISWQEFASRLAKADLAQFSQVAYLLNTFKDHRDTLLEKVSWQGFADRAAKAEVDQFNQVAQLLNALGNRRDALIDKVAWQSLAKSAAKAQVDQFGQVAQLLNALGNRRDALVDKVAWQSLAKSAAKAQVDQFGQVAQLLDALGNRRDVLLDMVDELALQALANSAARARAEEFAQLADFVSALGDHRNALLKKVDITSLARTANQCGGADLVGLSRFMNSLDVEQRSDLIRRVDWSLLSLRCPVRLGMLMALGSCLEGLQKKAEMSLDLGDSQKTAAGLKTQRESILQAVQDSYSHSKQSSSFYGGVAKFFYNYHRIDETSAIEIAEQTIGTAIRYFFITPAGYRHIGQLINVLNGLHPGLARQLLENRKIRGRIIWSLNKHDWAKECPGVRHLIKAIYRASPGLWTKMRRLITANLDSIDLESLYAEVKQTEVGALPSGPE